MIRVEIPDNIIICCNHPNELVCNMLKEAGIPAILGFVTGTVKVSHGSLNESRNYETNAQVFEWSAYERLQG